MKLLLDYALQVCKDPTAMTSEWQRDFEKVLEELDELKKERTDAEAKRQRAK